MWEYVGGARPAVVARLVGSDPGLAPSALYGSPGEFTPAVPSVAAADPLAQLVETTLPPLERYAVVDPGAMVRAYAPGGTVLVAGDGSAVDGLVRYGLVDGTGEFRLLGATTVDQPGASWPTAPALSSPTQTGAAPRTNAGWT